MKKWKSLSVNPGKSKRICEELSLPTFIGDILVARGLDTPTKVKAFLTTEAPFTDPFAYPDVGKAAARIIEAVDEGQKVCVYGDYDCDGMTATVLMYDYLQSIGADVWYYIPDRDREGYGLNIGAVDYISSKGTDLIVTVDNGVSAIDEIAYAKSLNIDVVVTDHHKPREVLPDAVAVVDPHRADCADNENIFHDLAGVGVAFKVVCALENDNGWGVIDQYADLICIGTVADIVPLIGENRTLVRQGLSIMSETNNMGLGALLELCGLGGKIPTAEGVAFGLAPRLNSAARLGTAYDVIEMLTTEDEERAIELAKDLCEKNRTRQELEGQIVSEVDKMFTTRPELFYDRVVVVDGHDWHHGVIGIVCSKIVERTGKPCILISSDGEEARGSARSVEGFSMIDAVSASSHCLTRYGGHPFAAGMSLKADKIEEFRIAINKYAEENFPMMPVYTLKIDRIIDPAELTVENVKALGLLEPFGCKNETPVFAFRKVIIDGVYPIGNGKHIRIKLKKAGMVFYAVYFGVSAEDFPYSIGEIVDLAATAEINEYNGETKVSIKVRDIRPSSLSQERLFNGMLTYDACKRGEPLSESSIPDRGDFAKVYRYLRTAGCYNGHLDVLFGKITADDHEGDFDACKLMLTLDVMEELGLIRREGNISKTQTIVPDPSTQKVDIADSNILKEIRKRA